MSVLMATTAPHPSEAVADTWVGETERLLIRRLTRDDQPTLIELFGSLQVMRFSTTGPLAPPQVAQVLDQILQSYEDSPMSLWGVVEKSDQQLIGLCGFLWRETPSRGESELAYRFLPRYWRQGLATEAARFCRDLAFLSPTVQSVTALLEQGNRGSVRVAEKVGLQFQTATHVNGLPVLKYDLRRPRAPHRRNCE